MKLSAGHKHILNLIGKESQADGWAPVSATVAQLFLDKKDSTDPIPEELFEFELVGSDGRGRARLTPEGQSVLAAMAWL